MSVLHFSQIGSTNDHLAGLAESGAREWTVVVADRQTAGRGRGRRSWWSPEGNLHMSILLRPDVSPRRLLRLPALASLAFLSAMGRPGSSLVVKWPNDVLLDGRKMAGILAQSRSEKERVLWAVVGFGVNMRRPEEGVPPELGGRMAFVRELDERMEANDLAVRILQNMKEYSEALKDDKIWDAARKRWSRRALLGQAYTYRDGDRKIDGVAIRMDENGGLVLETQNGEITVYSGEIEKV